MKEETEDVDDAEVDRTPRQRTLSSSRAKRRRGEEALLLDDHLLPPELRRSGPTAHKRKHSKGQEDRLTEDGGKVKEDEEMGDGEEEVDVDPVQAVEEEEEDEDGDEDEQDVTRCVCQRDGELFTRHQR